MNNSTNKIIENLFEINNDNKFLTDDDFCNKIENHELFKNVNLNKLSKDDIYVRLYVVAIDYEDIEFFNYLFNNDIKKENRDIIYDIYKINSPHAGNCLTPKRMEFILEMKSNVLISSNLIRKLIHNRNTQLLNILFIYSRFYDNKRIIEFCGLYKYKKPTSTRKLRNIVSDERYKIEYNNIFNYLTYACIKGHEHIVKYLIANGMSITEEYNQYTPLTAALRNKNENIENIVKYLIERGANVNQKQNGVSPLYIACEARNENLVKCLVENGADADINHRDWNGNTPFTAACQSGNENILKYLIENGAEYKDEFFNKKKPR